MKKLHAISALVTPLTDDEQLHSDGLRALLDRHAAAQLDGILVAGTMGLLQLLTDETYEQLVTQASEHWRQHGETLIGVGDTSFSRTKQRIEFVNRFDVDGTVALAPFFINFSQAELIDYYEALAKESRSPLYLYDLPQRTGTALEFETVARLARHPNIAGIKCSSPDVALVRRIHDELSNDQFRVIVAQPLLVDVLLHTGINQTLDGVYCLAPHWTQEMSQLAEQQEWSTLATQTQRLGKLLEVVRDYGVFQTATALLNAQGVSGHCLPRPFAALSDEKRQRLLEEPVVQQLITTVH